MVTNPCREHKAHKTGWHGRLVQLPKQQRREIRSSQPVPPSPTKQTLPLPPTELQRSQGVHCPVASELLYCRNGTNYTHCMHRPCSRHQMSLNDQRSSMTPGSATTRSALPSNYMKVTTAGYAALCCSYIYSTSGTAQVLHH